jgi:hypothetical protein
MSALSAAPPTPLHAHHARELYEQSGIDPAIVAARGCRSVTAAETARLGFAPSQQRDGLLFPQWTLAGVQVGYLLKPDEPRLNEKGKPVKYEAPADSRPHFDIHPDAVHVLQDASTPLYFTEGVKKSDAAWSRGVACVSITSVWMFLNGRLVVPDLDEIALRDRVVRVTFDSDVARKDAVAEALLRFCAVLDRRGARVEVVYLPEGPNGGKVGLDDWLVAGGTVEQLDDLARPWDGKGPGVWLRENEESDLATLRRERDAARADKSALVSAILNPEVTRNQLIVAVSVASEALAKKSRGEAEPTGQVILSAAEISDDWRKVPDKANGERLAPLNPKSQRRPRMARERVTALMTDAVERGLIPARPLPTPRRLADGTRYKATDWVVEPIPSLAAALQPWTTYRLDQPKIRKPRTLTPPCKSCGEVHPTRQIDYCGGCGAKLDERTIEPIVADDELDAETPESASDNLSEAPPTPIRTGPPASSPAPLRTVRAFVGGAHHNQHDEPDWLRDAPGIPPDEDDPSPPRTLFALPPPGCADCGAVVAQGHRYCRNHDPRTA